MFKTVLTPHRRIMIPVLLTVLVSSVRREIILVIMTILDFPVRRLLEEK